MKKRNSIEKGIARIPKAWIGFFSVVAYLIMDFVDLGWNSLIFMVAVAVAGMVYLFFCIGRIHQILNQCFATYQISTGKTVGYPFITSTGLPGGRMYSLIFINLNRVSLLSQG